MAAAPITIKLRCRSWAQLKSIYQRDLRRSALFLKSTKPPPLGTRIRVDLSLPSDSLIVLNGEVGQHVPPGGLGGRGPGIDLALDSVPQSAMWLIETALASAQKKSAAAGGRAQTAPASPATRGDTAASMDDDADLVDAESELVAALRHERSSLGRLNPFQILDIDYDADDARVREAFGVLTRKYHPDRFARYQSREARQHASEIFILIRDAYRKLGTKQGRQRALRALDANRGTPTRGTRPARPAATPRPQRSAPLHAGPAAPPAFTPRPPAARPPVRTTALTGDLFADAATTTSAPEADAASPIEVGANRRSHAPPTYTDAEQLITAGEYEQALAIYQRAARKNPGDRLARAGVELVEGLRSLAQRDRLEAAQRFEAVLELDPANERAARELAEMRRIATNERKGLLARLLGKKE